MALWGNIDDKGSNGTVSLNYATRTVTGSGTSFGQTGAASVGDIIRFGNINGVYHGDAVIVSIASTNQLSIASTSNLSGATINSSNYSISQLPKFTTLDSHFKAGLSTTYDALVYGVDAEEANASTTTSYDVTHSGWVGVTTYLDWEGNLRVKNEVLVAMSSIETDADDDVVFPDYVISIISQTSNRLGIATTSNTSFSVVATTTPPGGILVYQWQYASSVGAAYTDLIVNNIYSDVDADTLGIAATTVTADRPNGYYYRVVINTTEGGASVTSKPVRLTYS